MTTRLFQPHNQTDFAQLSGDFNPLHMDPLFSRRTVFGTTVVHGIHAFLWGLDHWFARTTKPAELKTLMVTFAKPIRVGDTVFVAIKENGDASTMEISTNEGVALKAEFTWTQLSTFKASIINTSPQRTLCRDLGFAEAEKASGRIPLHLNRQLFSELFPALDNFFSLVQSAQLLALTRLVGMECPGLHSVFYQLKLEFDPAREGEDELTFQVTKLDRRFGLISMETKSRGMNGSLSTFLRPPPQPQASYKEICSRVSPTEFSTQNALVIGGSRGLGEVTTKILSAGGAKVLFTYHQGRSDAERISQEIGDSKGNVSSLPFNIKSPDFSLLQEKPTHLYFFATPLIAGGKSGVFSDALYQNFRDYYVVGFSRIFEQMGVYLRGIFYPSSVFVGNTPPDMQEYARAKLEGEKMAEELKKSRPNLVLHIPRLPKMATDQTAGFIRVENPDPLPILLKELRTFQAQLYI